MLLAGRFGEGGRNLKIGVIILDLKIMELCHIGRFGGKRESFSIRVSFIFESSFFSQQSTALIQHSWKDVGWEDGSAVMEAEQPAGMQPWRRPLNRSRAFSSEDVDSCVRAKDVQLLLLLQGKIHNFHQLLRIRGANVNGS